ARRAGSSSRCATTSGSPTRTVASSAKVAQAPYDPGHHRFNDGRVDPQGRFWIGTMTEAARRR
ncbi:MAG: SMP-30/gluconolactonase/LRE family protein, partial [Betaproteobacteria bacterium]|nr:SMP-30/gluconolactonase/LRE family protein [Betaproteobacteria bacterium]